MCDLCSCFVHREIEIEIVPLERMIVTFVGERERMRAELHAREGDKCSAKIRRRNESD